MEGRGAIFIGHVLIHMRAPLEKEKSKKKLFRIIRIINSDAMAGTRAEFDSLYFFLFFLFFYFLF